MLWRKLWAFLIWGAGDRGGGCEGRGSGEGGELLAGVDGQLPFRGEVIIYCTRVGGGEVGEEDDCWQEQLTRDFQLFRF